MRKIIKSRFQPSSRTAELLIWQDGDLIERVTEHGEGDPVVTETIIKDPEKLAIETQATSDMQNIPGWATWDMTQVLNYIETNVTDLASAKVVLKAMAQMLVALRNKNWPGLGD